MSIEKWAKTGVGVVWVYDEAPEILRALYEYANEGELLGLDEAAGDGVYVDALGYDGDLLALESSEAAQTAWADDGVVDLDTRSDAQELARVLTILRSLGATTDGAATTGRFLLFSQG